MIIHQLHMIHNWKNQIHKLLKAVQETDSLKWQVITSFMDSIDKSIQQLTARITLNLIFQEKQKHKGYWLKEDKIWRKVTSILDMMGNINKWISHKVNQNMFHHLNHMVVNELRKWAYNYEKLILNLDLINKITNHLLNSNLILHQMLIKHK